MRHPVALFESFGRNVRVNLRGAEARMTEHFLNGAEVGAAVQEVRGGGMAKCVRP